MKKIVKFFKDDGSVITKHIKDAHVSDDDCKYTKIEIGEGIEKLEDWPFINAMSDQLLLPSTFKKFEEHSLDGCPHFGNISVSKKNPYLCSRSGVLYDKRMSKLVKYPNLYERSQVALPKSVNIIDNFAFKGCKIENLIIPETVFTVDSYAFGASSIKTIEFPEHPMFLGMGAFFFSGVEYISLPSEFYIGIDAFGCCNNLKVIKYPRDKHKWLKIVDYYELRIPQCCQVACKDGVISY